MSNSGSVAMMTVGEACRYVGVSRTTLLAAEEAQLIAPSRTPGGHRRYAQRDLDRLLGRGRGVGPSPAVHAPAGPRADLREPLRQLALLLPAESAALYDTRLRLAASFGVPRWLVAQLETEPPPEPVAAAAATGRPQSFDPQRACRHLPLTGEGLAHPVLSDGELRGVLVVVTGGHRRLYAGEAQTVALAATFLGHMTEQSQRIAALSRRLRDVQRLVAPTVPEPP